MAVAELLLDYMSEWLRLPVLIYLFDSRASHVIPGSDIKGIYCVEETCEKAPISLGAASIIN